MTHQTSPQVKSQLPTGPVDIHTPEGAIALFLTQEESRRAAIQILQQDPPLNPKHFGPYLGVISPEEQAERFRLARLDAFMDI